MYRITTRLVKMYKLPPGEGKISRDTIMTRVVGLKKEYWIYTKYVNFAISFGVTMAASLFLGYFGGNWLDRKLGTSPIFLVVGLLLGVAIAFYSLFKELKALERMQQPFEQGNGDAGDA